jgi:flagellar basal-body rod protein FlgB
MSSLVGGVFSFSDRLQMESLNQRLTRSEVLSANIANAETPGYRALGYDFESQLKELAGTDSPFPLAATNPQHYRNDSTEADGTILPDVYIRPSESIGQDGNTVDVDREMTDLAETQLKYRATVELLNRKIGIMRYAITQGGRG